MKILTVIGARPQFIKAAAVSRRLRECAHEVLVHTGQHYDATMSQVFFDALDIPRPDYNLKVGSGNHGEQTGAMLAGLEAVLLKERPDRVLVYGDTNSTLAGALAAAKLEVPVAHVEAGLRSYNRRMPEEINRVLTDHLSDLLFCPSQTAVANLAAEGIRKGVHLSGDVMYEALIHATKLAERQSFLLERLRLPLGEYVLATMHRAENVDAPETLARLMDALREMSRHLPVVFLVHPRTRRKLHALPGCRDAKAFPDLHLLEPVGYLDMVRLETGARVIVTDSGGVQKEAFWSRVPCVTLRRETEWVETVEQGWNVLAGSDKEGIVEAAIRAAKPETFVDSYNGKGSVERILECLK